MGVTQKEIEKFRSGLMEWRGGTVSFNVFHDDHDRLTLRLEHPTGGQQPIGLILFYCDHICGPIRWKNNQLDLRTWVQEDGVTGIEVFDDAAGFSVRCASASLYGEPGITIPNS